MKFRSTLKRTSAIRHVVIDGVDAAFAKAVEVGAKEIDPVIDQ